MSIREGKSVCKIMDFGKYLYQKQKKVKKTKPVGTTKELRFTLNIGEHDYKVKMDHMREFLSDGHKVKITIIIKGRMMPKEIIDKMCDKIISDTEDFAKINGTMERVGNRVSAIFNAKTSK